MADSTPLLTYFDSTIYPQDLSILKSETEWLNDSCISYWFQVLANEEYQDFAAEPSGACFLDPTAAFMLRFIPPEDLLVDSADNVYQQLATKSTIFLPINNSEDAESAGSGSHWSLIMYHRAVNSFFYCDSMGTYNLVSGRATASKLVALLKPVCEPKFVAIPCPAQKNSYDCGIYTLWFVQMIAKRLCADGSGATSAEELASDISTLLHEENFEPGVLRGMIATSIQHKIAAEK